MYISSSGTGVSRLEVDPDRGADALGLGRAQRARRGRAWSGAGVDGDRIGAEALRELVVDQVRHRAARRARARPRRPPAKSTRSAPSATRDRDGVEGDRCRAPAADQHRRAGRSASSCGADRAPGIGDVVREAGDGLRRDPLGNPDQHRVRVRHPGGIGDEAAVVGTERQPVGREELDRLAVAGLAQAAAAHSPQEIWNGTLTRSPGSTALDRVADLDHLGDALVAEGELRPARARGRGRRPGRGRRWRPRAGARSPRRRPRSAAPRPPAIPARPPRRTSVASQDAAYPRRR